ncbi:MAG: hypothetical protein IGS39_11695 [Calothrix sp. C42_A2020_038]|nr:hypothetical protein [Calothrix sp. C42_A2020_038]
MKAGIKRIETTLHNLDNRDNVPEALNVQSSTSPALSFEINSNSSTRQATPIEPSQQESEITSSQANQNNYTHESVQAFSVQSLQDSEFRAPNLPKFKTPSFTSHRNAANPALAANILSEIQQIVNSWQAELQTIIRQIQDIYIEGPIVNGWLESQSVQVNETVIGTATLRHAEVDRLMDYVEEICATQSQSTKPKVSSRTGYRLCGLDATGKVWSRPCPPEQVASVSMAIARYQKLRQLLGRKQYLENRLSQLAETLVMLHGHLKSQ